MLVPKVTYPLGRTIPYAFRCAGSVIGSLIFALSLLGSAVASDQRRDLPIRPPLGGVKIPERKEIPPSREKEKITLTPEEYKLLLDKAEQLKQLKSAKAQEPNRCLIQGKVETRGASQVAALTLEYQFETRDPKTVVALGCQSGQPTAFRTKGGKTPQLISGNDGLLAIIDEPGSHTLFLDLELPIRSGSGFSGLTDFLKSRGLASETGLELSLARAPITLLKFDPPEGVKGLTVGVRTRSDRDEVKRSSVDVTTLNADSGYALGDTNVLELSWSQREKSDLSLAVEIQSQVRISENQTTTTSKMTLRGEASEWLLYLPAGSTVEARAGSEIRDGGSESLPEGKGLTRVLEAKTHSLWRFAPPVESVREWTLMITASRNPVRPGLTQSNQFFGPCAVQAAYRGAGRAEKDKLIVRHTGTLTIQTPRGHQAFLHGTNPEWQQIDSLPGEEETTLVFKMIPGIVPLPTPSVHYSIRPTPVSLQVQPAYSLHRADGFWKLRGKFKVTPIRTEVETVRVQVPRLWSGVMITTGEAGVIAEIEEDGKGTEGESRSWLVRFTTARRKSVDLTVSATTPSESRDETKDFQQVQIPLPFLLMDGSQQVHKEGSPQLVERESSLSVEIPEGYEASGTIQGTTGAAPLRDVKDSVEALPIPLPGKILAANLEGGIRNCVLNFRIPRPEMTATVAIDLLIQEHQTVVRQNFVFRSKGNFMPIRLAAPKKEPTGLRFMTRGTPPERLSPEAWLFLPPDGVGECRLSLTYAVAEPEELRGDRTLSFFRPDRLDRVETTLRVWNRSSNQSIYGFRGDWREVPPDASSETDSFPETADALPVLTLENSGIDTGVTLKSRERTLARPRAVVERMLVQAAISESGSATISARARIRRTASEFFDLELPSEAVTVEIFHDGRRVLPTLESDVGDARLIQLRLPESEERVSSELVIKYALPARDRRNVRLLPPRFLDRESAIPTRWEVIVPSEVVATGLGNDHLHESRWSWRRGLFQPTAPAHSVLESWLKYGTLEAEPFDLSLVSDSASERSHFRQTYPEPLNITLVPRTIGIGVVSALALIVGLSLLRFPGEWIGPALAALGLGVLVATLLRPGPSSWVIAAAEPGLAIPLLLALYQFVSSFKNPLLRRTPAGFARDWTDVSTQERPARTPVPAPLSPAPLGQIGSSRRGQIPGDPAETASEPRERPT